MNRKNIAGQRFNHLTAIRPIGSDELRRALWLCECDCGATRNVVTAHLTGNVVKACWDCSKVNQAKGGDGLMRVWREALSHFTQEQMARFDELVRGRSDWRIKAEAVDVVMRETAVGALGKCCARCAEAA